MEQVWEHLETEAFTAEREWCVEGIPVLTAAVSLPRPVGPQTRTLRRIRRYYRAQAGAFLRYCQRQLLPMAAEAYRVARAASRAISSAYSWLMGQQALALPLLAATPQAVPSSRCSMVT